MISFEDDFEQNSAINPNWRNYEKNNSSEIQPVNQLEKTKQVRVYHSSSDEDEEEKGQAHHMFSLFLNPRIYDFFHQFSLFCLIVFLQDGSFLLRSKMPILQFIITEKDTLHPSYRYET